MEMNKENGKTYFDQEQSRRIRELLAHLEQPLILKLYLDNRPLSRALEEFATALGALSDQLSVLVVERDASPDTAPCLRVCGNDGAWTGLAFHGVPGGHELLSFVTGLCNVGGPEQPLDQDIQARVQAITGNTQIQVLVTLTCPMCPDTVTAAQAIAARNPNVTAEVYDVTHFEALRTKYHVMSVPTLVINGEVKAIGKRNLKQILDLIRFPAK